MLALTGNIIALEIYTPETLPLRRIEAIGDSVPECIGQLQARGLIPAPAVAKPVPLAGGQSGGTG